MASHAQAQTSDSEEITLDPVCETVDSRNPSLPPGNPAPSTRQMAGLLSAYYDNADPEIAAYMSDRMVTVIETQITNATELNQKLRLLFGLGIRQTQAGRPDKALNTFGALERLIAESHAKTDDRTRVELRMRKAIAFLRLGEQENCLAAHNADSCVLPLRPQAYHLLPHGSRGAIALFDELLEEFPSDVTTRWLLNLAHMTLGEYPDKVPHQFLIPR
ncbi:MAG TPA: hypothetical protein VL361_22890 [Candidatus Limnocylindrales bacterium]|nr:hypothetical protein [Candidatus Limnocylindrales bacterium]